MRDREKIMRGKNEREHVRERLRERDRVRLKKEEEIE